jgi:hypothetical protein
MNGQGFGGFESWLGPTLAFGFFLIPGPRELVLVVVVAMALYGKFGSRLLMSTRYGRMVGPWIRLAQSSFGTTAKPAPTRSARAAAVDDPQIRPRPEPHTPGRQGRLFWALALTAAVAVAAWVATRMVIHNSAGLPR